jgi:hypothetical protein
MLICVKNWHKRQGSRTKIGLEELLSANPPVGHICPRGISTRTPQVGKGTACCDNIGATYGQGSRGCCRQAAQADGDQSNPDNPRARFTRRELILTERRAKSTSDISFLLVEPKASEKQGRFEFMWHETGRPAGLLTTTKRPGPPCCGERATDGL